MSEGLPKGWTKIPFAALLTDLRNGIPTRPNLEPPGTPILRISAVRPGSVLLDDHRFLRNGDDLATTFALRDRDLLFTRYNGSLGLLGVCGMVRKRDPAVVLYPDKLMRARVDARLTSPAYIEMFFQSAEARDAIMAIAKSSAGQQGISGANLKEQVVALAPLAEQDRIVEKVETLIARVTGARDRLAKVPAILKRFRQSVVAAACSGRLTQGWRAEQPELTVCDFDHEAGDEWLEPMFEHREKQELPPTWRYVALGNLGSWGSGGTPSKAREDYWKAGTVPWVSPKDMKVSLIGDSQDHITDLAVRSGAAMVPRGTILFVVRGMILAHTFPVGLTTRSVTFNQDIRSIAPCEQVSPTYLLHALQREGLNILFAVKEATHGTLRLESSTLRHWPIAVPPLEEQAEIVRRVALLMDLADTIQDRVAVASTCVGALIRGILAKAFGGELVPTEAELARDEGRDYESAEALLTRIRSERIGDVPSHLS